MKTFSMAIPAPVSGLYALTNKHSKEVYIGSTVNLRHRHMTWCGVLSGRAGGGKGKHVRDRVRDLNAENWEFVVLRELPGFSPAELAPYERRMIARAAKKRHVATVNELWRGPEDLPRTAPLVRRGGVPKSVILGPDGVAMSYDDVAEQLGAVSKKGLMKRLKKYRERGILTVSLQELQRKTKLYRPPRVKRS